MNSLLRKLVPTLCLSLLLAAAALTAGCAVGKVPEFARNGVVNSHVRDTLFVNLPQFENEWVKVSIRTTQVDYVARERVENGRAWFLIGSLPTGEYTVWIDFAGYSFPQHIWHEVTY
ncbi:MAG: hypothetical protein IJ244_06720 [Bacteroidaceae bacterium]|nr:hypothetical protein [Bacteroidaceae bacterium]